MKLYNSQEMVTSLQSFLQERIQALDLNFLQQKNNNEE